MLLNAKQQKQQILKVDITSVRSIRLSDEIRQTIVFFHLAGKFLLFRPNNLILQSTALLTSEVSMSSFQFLPTGVAQRSDVNVFSGVCLSVSLSVSFFVRTIILRITSPNVD